MRILLLVSALALCSGCAGSRWRRPAPPPPADAADPSVPVLGALTEAFGDSLSSATGESPRAQVARHQSEGSY